MIIFSIFLSFTIPSFAAGGGLDPAVIVALIGAAGTVLAALLQRR